MVQTYSKFIWIICPTCHGNGKVDHPAFSNGITSSEWAEMDHDDRDSYMSGAYDVRCDPCGGSGKVQQPDIEAMTFAEKRVLVQQRRAERDVQDMLREEEAERRFGC